MYKEKTAKFIKDVSEDFKGIAKLYKLNIPIDDIEYLGKINYVIVSKINYELRYYKLEETYIFPADKNGNILDLGQLDGSEQGPNISHEKVLNNAGYKVKEK